jgi:hypothetical protein
MGISAGWLVLMLAAPAADPETPKTAPAATFLLRDRHARVTPVRTGSTRTGGGLIDVAQPTPDVLVVTLTGVAVASDHPFCVSSATMNFDLEQCFDVVLEGKPRPVRLTIEGRVVGLLRSGKKGTAEDGAASATVDGGPLHLIGLTFPAHSVGGEESLAVNDRVAPGSVLVGPGPHSLRVAWQLTATHDKALLGKAASAEFAPDPALDPIWISMKESFHGIPKKDLGFQIVLRLSEELAPEPKAPSATPDSQRPLIPILQSSYQQTDKPPAKK